MATKQVSLLTCLMEPNEWWSISFGCPETTAACLLKYKRKINRRWLSCPMISLTSNV